MVTEPFTTELHFNAVMNDGHILRHGHPIRGYWDMSPGQFRTLVRECCNES
jgi:hypothetical protein